MREVGAPLAPARVFSIGAPVLGICYGQMAMCAQLGGRVAIVFLSPDGADRL